MALSSERAPNAALGRSDSLLSEKLLIDRPFAEDGRLDALDANAPPEPPDGELAQVEQAVMRSEGNTLSQRMLAGRPRSLCYNPDFSGTI